MAINKKLTLKL